MKTVNMYTDGACSGNQNEENTGGWGCILEYAGREKELHGGEVNTTNNRMELSAPIAGLSALKEKGLTLAVATSKPLDLAEQLLGRAGMREFFGVVCGSRLDGNNNSKQEIVERVIASLGAEKEDCVLIGDTKYDVAGAHAAGVKCICVRYGYAAPGELEEAGADAIAGDLCELQKMLTCGENLI